MFQLRQLRDEARRSVTAVRDQAGINLAGMKLLKRSLGADRATIAAPTSALATTFDIDVSKNTDGDTASFETGVTTSTKKAKKGEKSKGVKKKKAKGGRSG